jgi:hypothetical protein
MGLYRNIIVAAAMFVATAVTVSADMAFDRMNLQFNYVAVQGQLISSSETCTLYRHHRYIGGDRESDAVPCDLAQRALRESPNWQTGTIRYDTSLNWTYRSPDGLLRQGTTHIALPRETLPADGEAIQVYVQKSDFDRSRYGGVWREGA